MATQHTPIVILSGTTWNPTGYSHSVTNTTSTSYSYGRINRLDELNTRKNKLVANGNFYYESGL